jgi:hypothetical protein
MTNRQNIHIRKQMDKLKEKFGGRCWNCGSTVNLQFAHIKETDINGRGRGRKERYYDIIKHPESYALLCGGDDGVGGCHKGYDGGAIPFEKFFQVIKI